MVDQIIIDKVKESDYVLIGIGEEWEADVNTYKLDNPSQEIMETENNEIWRRLISLRNASEDPQVTKKLLQAYTKLAELLKDRDYFIITTNIDDVIWQSPLRKDRIVAPCGSVHRFQCDQHIWKDETTHMDDNSAKPHCHICQMEGDFNVVSTKDYIESEYLEQWNEYTKWLMGTLNQKLCILELGVGLAYPSVIRWPFEKTAYINAKSSFIRMHSKLPHLTTELKDKGISIKKSPIDALIS